MSSICPRDPSLLVHTGRSRRTIYPDSCQTGDNAQPSPGSAGRQVRPGPTVQRASPTTWPAPSALRPPAPLLDRWVALVRLSPLLRRFFVSAAAGSAGAQIPIDSGPAGSQEDRGTAEGRGGQGSGEGQPRVREGAGLFWAGSERRQYTGVGTVRSRPGRWVGQPLSRGWREAGCSEKTLGRPRCSTAPHSACLHRTAGETDRLAAQDNSLSRRRRPYQTTASARERLQRLELKERDTLTSAPVGTRGARFHNHVTGMPVIFHYRR